LTDQEMINKVSDMSQLATVAAAAFGGVAAMQALKKEAEDMVKVLPDSHWFMVARWIDKKIEQALNGFEQATG